MNVVILQTTYILRCGFSDQVRHADLFVFYYNTQYEKYGWHNHSWIKTIHGKQWLTIPDYSKKMISRIPSKDLHAEDAIWKN